MLGGGTCRPPSQGRPLTRRRLRLRRPLDGQRRGGLDSCLRRNDTAALSLARGQEA